MIMARLEIGAVALSNKRRDDEKADGTTADNGNALSRRYRCHANAVPRHRGRLDQTRIGNIESRRQGNKVLRKYEYPIGQTAVDKDPEVRVLTDAALRLARCALITRSAEVRRFNSVGNSIDKAGELVSEREARQADGGKSHVGPTNT
jgi:hypothetical protein